MPTNNQPTKRPAGRPRKGEESTTGKSPENLLTEGITENLGALKRMRLKIDRQLKQLEDTLDKGDLMGENGLERRQGALKTYSETYKTISDATVNAVKALASLSKLEGKGQDPSERDAEILEKLFGTNEEGNESENETE